MRQKRLLLLTGASLVALITLASPSFAAHRNLSSHRTNHGTIANRVYAPHIQKYHSGSLTGQHRTHSRTGNFGRSYRTNRHFGFRIGSYGSALYYYNGYPANYYGYPYSYSNPSYAYYDYSYRPQYAYPVQPVAAPAAPQSPRVTGAQPQTLVVKSSPIYAAEQERLINDALRGDASQRLQAVEGLVEFPNIGAVAALQEAMINDADAAIRAEAARTLGAFAAPIAYIALLRSESYDGNPQVRTAASNALDEIRRQTDPANLPTGSLMIPMNYGRAGLGDYLELLRFGPNDQRRAAIQRLADHQGTQAIVGIVNSLINDPGIFVRAEAAIQLAKIPDPLVLPFLDSAATEDPQRRVRLQALKAIQKLQKPRP